MEKTPTPAKHEKFLKSLLLGDRASCSEYAHQYVEHTHSIPELYENVIKTSLYDIGKLWEYNQISVATEHLASAIVEAILNEFYNEIVSAEKHEKTVILSCIEEEQHQIGIKMINDVFERHGWNSYFLGANTPTKELIDYTKLIKPDLIAVSMSIYFHLPNLERTIMKIRKEFPHLTILVGGQAFEHGGKEVLEQYDDVYYKPDLRSTELFVNKHMQNG